MIFRPINSFFTSRIPIARLAMFRILFCMALVVYLLSHSFLLDSPYQGHYYPIPLFETLNIPFWDLSTNKLIYGCLIFCLSFSAIGIKSRWFLILSSIFYFLFLGHHLGSMRSPHSPYVWHSHNMNLYLLMTLGLLPSVARFNVFDLFRGKAKGVAGFYWEEVILILVICSAYFGSGYLKILTAGLRWVDGHTLQAYMLQKYILTDNPIALWIGSQFSLLVFISWLTILLEVFFIFGLLFKRTRWVVLIMTFSFHFVILKSMEINFIYSHFLPYSMFFIAMLLEKNGWYKSRVLRN